MFFKEEKVNIQTIDNFILNNNINNIDILKIDTLGFENKVLKGAKNSLSIINLILIEFRSHDIYMDYNPEEAHYFLLNNNFLLSKTFKFPLMNWEDRAYINSNFKKT